MILFSVLIIPGLIVEGYMVRVLRLTERGDTEAPTFSDWEKLAIDGLKVVGISFGYALLPIALAIVFVGGGGVMVSAGNAELLGGLAILFGTLVTLLASVGIWYVYPAALARFAETDSMSAAFQFGALKPILVKSEYATGWLMALVVLLGGGAVIWVLALIPILGWLAALFVAFYMQVAASYIYGRAYGEASGMDVGGEKPIEGEQPVV